MNKNAVLSIVSDYEHWIPKLVLPDADDRHVLAAALESKADFIVTFNTRHFPKSVLSTYNLVAIKPDDFLCNLFDVDSDVFMNTILILLETLKKPPITFEQQCQSWSKLGLKKMVQKVIAYSE